MKSTAIALAMLVASLSTQAMDSGLKHTRNQMDSSKVARQASITDELQFLSTIGPEWKVIDEGVYSAYDGQGSVYTVHYGESGLKNVLSGLKAELSRLEIDKNSKRADVSDRARKNAALIEEKIAHLQAPSEKLSVGSTGWVCLSFATGSDFNVTISAPYYTGHITSSLGPDDWGLPGSIGTPYARVEATDLGRGLTTRKYTNRWYGQPFSTSLSTETGWECGMRTLQLVRGCGQFYQVTREASCSSTEQYSEVISEGQWP